MDFTSDRKFNANYTRDTQSSDDQLRQIPETLLLQDQATQLRMSVSLRSVAILQTCRVAPWSASGRCTEKDVSILCCRTWST